MKTSRLVTSVCLLALGMPAVAAEPPPIQDTPLSGGEGSVKQFDHNAFSLPLGNLPMTKRLDFSVGNSFFRNPWVEAPSSTAARDGLGPLFNTNSCQGCHLKDGRGHPPGQDEAPIGLFLRLSVPADPEADAELLKTHGFKPVPVYGSQLQTGAISGQKPEADLVLTWEPIEQTLADGTTVTLEKPVYHIKNPNYGSLPDNLMTSPRVAPPMIGLGLISAIPEKQILQSADPEDNDNDGISGRANRVWDKAEKATVVGRFGWKAGEPTILQQSMGAFAGDMGLTSAMSPATDCSAEQKCEGFANGGEPEVSDKIARFIAFYASSLAVPERRNMNQPAVRQGAQLFNDIGCAGCHTPRHSTGTVPDRPDLSGQTIWPYTDLLLHDMGPALADGRGEFEATGNEWRTSPLWGLGLAQTVNPRAGFLHDGRARTPQEAILWHGGEAREATDKFRSLESSQRDALLQFLDSL